MQKPLHRSHRWYSTGKGQLTRDLQLRSCLHLLIYRACHKTGDFHWEVGTLTKRLGSQDTVDWLAERYVLYKSEKQMQFVA